MYFVACDPALDSHSKSLLTSIESSGRRLTTHMWALPVLVFAVWNACVVPGSGGKHYLDHGYHGLDLAADGSYQATELIDNAWKNLSCSPAGFRDFYIDATSANTHDNLFVEIVHIAENKNVKLDALSVGMHFDVIPANRETGNIRRISPDGVYSLAINANEIKEGRYFISVQCNNLEAANFGTLAKYETAVIHIG